MTHPTTASDATKTGFTYADAGVNIDAGNALVEDIRPVVRATARPGTNAEIGGFGGLFDLKAAGFKDPILVAANDGVGTKVKIAIDTDCHDRVGIDLVAMCVNDIIVQGAEPLFFLDYYATGKLKPATGVALVKGIAQGCILAGAALIGGETAEMPGLYSHDDYDLAGFAVGAAERGTLLPRLDALQVGDVILGLASSGVHSNGFSLVRRIVAAHKLTWDAPCPFKSGTTLGEALLEPTRIYVKPLLATIRETQVIHALAHITGGGFVDNIPRVLPDHLGAHIHLSQVPSLPVFRWLEQAGQLSQTEMVRTFNCGIGMICVVPADKADEVMAVLAREGETVVRLGALTPRGSEPVTFDGALA